MQQVLKTKKCVACGLEVPVVASGGGVWELWCEITEQLVCINCEILCPELNVSTFEEGREKDGMSEMENVRAEYIQCRDVYRWS